MRQSFEIYLEMTVQASPRVVRAASRARIIQIGLTGLRGSEIAREKNSAGNRENIVIFVSEAFYFVRSIPVIMDCEATVCKAHRESSGVAWPFCRHLGCAFAKHPVSR